MREKCERMCICCRTHKQKSEMLRCVRQKGEDVVLDLKQSLFGRGAYICADVQCIKRVNKTGALRRAFKSNIKPEVFDCLNKIAKNLEDSFGKNEEF
ncbi:hypothetical protein FACS1894198_3070 [Clostridia bacterium]|nr:hypothetical protein FACS1894198_3070 [Clostridia bacterium]